VHLGLPEARILPGKPAGQRTIRRTGITARIGTSGPRLAPVLRLLCGPAALDVSTKHPVSRLR
jgi:hypothetical protein